jgi:hypothetical protein
LETIEATTPQAVNFHLTGGLSSGTVHIWETDATHTFEHVADVPVTGGSSFAYTFDPASLYSLTTTIGQAKGTAVPPPAKAFPFPYRDDFEGTARNRAPKYLADQDGAFEVQSCRERQGLCLEQAILRKPIPWSPLPDPFTIVGDVNWRDYTVMADTQVPVYGAATLMARIDSADVFKDGNALYPSGYIFRVAADGHWQLLSTAYKMPTVTLASGVTTGLDRGWHHIQLKCNGNNIEASIDAKPLAQVKDFSHSHGMFALGSNWAHVQFDNVAVEAN